MSSATVTKTDASGPAYTATIRHLRAFLAVARHQNFTRAATELRLSQPSLTMTIRQLEDIVAASLFDRTTRKVVLTPEGTDLFPVAQRLVSDFDFAIRDIRLTAATRNSCVRLAVVSSVATQIIPDVLKSLRETHPGIRVQLHEGNSNEVRRLVRRNEVDLGFGSKDGDEPELSFEPLFRDRLGLVMQRNETRAETAAYGALTWKDLENRSFVGVTDATATAPILSTIPQLPESVELPRYEVSSYHLMWSLVESGLAVSTAPALAARNSQQRGVVFSVLEEPVAWRIVWKIARVGRTIPPVTKSVVREIENHLIRVSKENDHVETEFEVEGHK